MVAAVGFAFSTWVVDGKATLRTGIRMKTNKKMGVCSIGYLSPFAVGHSLTLELLGQENAYSLFFQNSF